MTRLVEYFITAVATLALCGLIIAASQAVANYQFLNSAQIARGQSDLPPVGE